MDAFSYLSVLLSIILGLAVAEVLQGYRKLVLARGAAKLDPIPLLWSALILLFAAQSWWASFGLNSHREWTFLGFAIILIQVGFLYMAAAIVLPDPDLQDRADIEHHFEQHRKLFFSLLIGMLLASVIKDWVLDHHLPSRENLLFHATFIATAIGGILLSSRRWQYGLVMVTALGGMAYIGLLFATLRGG